MSHEFEDIIDLSGLDADEIGRLRHVHDLLVAAGPPADLPLELSRAPRTLAAVPSPATVELVEVTAPASENGSSVIAISSRRRRATALLAFAAAIATAAFGAGYLTGNNGSGLSPIRVVAMTGDQNALASVRVGSVDPSGNLPLQLSVSGLPKLSNAAAYYELFLTQGGKPSIPCGGFRVTSGTTTVQFTVPYAVDKNSHWVVTAVDPANQGLVWPGHVVMRTT